MKVKAAVLHAPQKDYSIEEIELDPAEERGGPGTNQGHRALSLRRAPRHR